MANSTLTASDVAGLIDGAQDGRPLAMTYFLDSSTEPTKMICAFLLKHRPGGFMTAMPNTPVVEALLQALRGRGGATSTVYRCRHAVRDFEAQSCWKCDSFLGGQSLELAGVFQESCLWKGEPSGVDCDPSWDNCCEADFFGWLRTLGSFLLWTTLLSRMLASAST